ncbi:MAG: hypothetical protein O7D86_07845, partial [Proteobacteria bacterium]|nr:hypothetical protein [Pseudomonadota bacterium]
IRFCYFQTWCCNLHNRPTPLLFKGFDHLHFGPDEAGYNVVWVLTIIPVGNTSMDENGRTMDIAFPSIMGI